VILLRDGAGSSRKAVCGYAQLAREHGAQPFEIVNALRSLRTARTSMVATRNAPYSKRAASSASSVLRQRTASLCPAARATASLHRPGLAVSDLEAPCWKARAFGM
jgi:hypothetical protein